LGPWQVEQAARPLNWLPRSKMNLPTASSSVAGRARADDLGLEEMAEGFHFSRRQVFGLRLHGLAGPFAGLEVGQLLGDVFLLAGQARKDGAGRLPQVAQESSGRRRFPRRVPGRHSGHRPLAQAEQAAGDKMTCDFFQDDPLSVFFDLYHKIINRLHWPFKP
jgi:hypothetical protein